MSTSRNTWKRREREIAKFFFSERTPLSGGNSKHTRSDSLSPIFYVEAKFRAKQAVAALFKDTEIKAKAEDKIPVVALCQKGDEGFLIVTSQKYFSKLARAYRIERKRQKELKKGVDDTE